jgi:hypothetical protein
MTDTSPKIGGLRHAGRLIAWILAVLFLLISIAGMFSGGIGSKILATGFLIAGLLILPPFVAWLRMRVRVARPYWAPPAAAFGAVFLAMIIGSPLLPASTSAERPASSPSQGAKKTKPTRRERDLAEIERLLAAPSKENARDALSILRRYRRDTEPGGQLNAVFTRATAAMAVAVQTEKSQALLRRIADQTAKVEAIYEKRPDLELTILANLATMDDAAKTLEASRESGDNPEVKTAAERLRSRLIAKQRVALPVMRAAYAAIKDEALWEADTDVAVRGAGNRTLRMVSAIFAANRNIAQVQRQIGDTLYMLRFARAEYKWYRESRDTTFYTLETPTDGEVGYWSGPEFKAVPSP